MFLLAVRMVADVTETRNVIPSLEFKTCMTIKSLVFRVYFFITFKIIYHSSLIVLIQIILNSIFLQIVYLCYNIDLLSFESLTIISNN